VDNPLLGPRGAARVFGPQKGATGDQVAALEEGLERLADRIRADLGVDVAERWGAGACGGIGAGLIAFLGAELAPGFDIVAEAAGLSAQLEEADLVITGEGRLDEQSLAGKTPVGVARLAGAAGVTCAAVAGEVAVGRVRLEAAGFALVASLTEAFGRERALTETDAAVAEVTAELVARLVG
jgi:glycerate 2-kinase